MQTLHALFDLAALVGFFVAGGLAAEEGWRALKRSQRPARGGGRRRR